MFRSTLFAAATIILALACASRMAGAAEPASADPPACVGKDLFAEAQRNDPAAYREIMERTGRVPNAEGLLWRIEKGAVAPSDLFGTMHATDAGAVALARGVTPYLKTTHTIATELGAAMGPGMKTAVGIKLALRALMSKPDTGSLIESAADRDQLEQALTALHLDPALVLRMPPWFVTGALAIPACEMERQAQNLPVVDQVLVDIGTRFGEELVGLETLDEQIAALESLDPKVAVRMILTSLRKPNFLEDFFATMVALYEQQRIGAAVPTLDIAAGLSPEDTAAGAALTARIVDQRNLVMRRRAEPLIDAGPTFIAVGAMHLVGAGGLIELLRQDGYSVTRVP